MNEDWASETNESFVDPPATSSEIPTGTTESLINAPDEQEPDRFLPFDQRNVSVDKIASLIFTGVVSVASIIGLVVLLSSIGLSWIFYLVAGVVSAIVLLLLYLSFAWPKIEHRHRSWRLTQSGLEIRHGVWWKHLQAVPWARVQHADVSQGPLQRIYSIGTLTVHTAGTSNSSVALTGLAHQQAIDLRDQIVRQRSSSDVV